MSRENDGGPAFPHPDYLHMGWSGQSLRDYFATHAPPVPDDFGWIAGEKDEVQRISRWAYFYADVMLLERTK